jgi:hypothetical protein
MQAILVILAKFAKILEFLWIKLPTAVVEAGQRVTHSGLLRMLNSARKNLCSQDDSKSVDRKAPSKHESRLKVFEAGSRPFAIRLHA